MKTKIKQTKLWKWLSSFRKAPVNLGVIHNLNLKGVGVY